MLGAKSPLHRVTPPTCGRCDNTEGGVKRAMPVESSSERLFDDAVNECPHPLDSDGRAESSSKGLFVDRNSTSTMNFNSMKEQPSLADPRAHGEAKKRMRQEFLWQEFFADTSQWWDNRRDKRSPQDPDFRHKTKNGALTIHSRFAPTWLEAKLADVDAVAQVPCVSTACHASRDPSSCVTSSKTCAWMEETGVQHVRNLCDAGRLEEAIEFALEMDRQGVMVSMETYECLLRTCSKVEAIAEAEKLHGHISAKGLEANKYLGNSSVLMFVKCGALQEALQVFSRLPHRTVSSWTAIIAGCIKGERYEEALDLYQKMQQEGLQPNKYTFASLLKACGSLTDLQKGRQIHTEAVKRNCELDYFVGTALVDMYVKCGSLLSAHDVFDRLSERDVVSWNSMIAGYTHQQQGEKALQLYVRMQEEGVVPNNWIFVSALKASVSFADSEEAVSIGSQFIKSESLRRCQAIHCDIRRLGYGTDVFIANTLISVYAKCGSILDARNVFDSLADREMVSWSAMIAVYAEQEMGETALRLYAQMHEEGVKPIDRIFVSALKACGSLAATEQAFSIEGQSVKFECLRKVQAIHAEILEESCGLDVFVGNTLVYTYAKCGSITHAQEVFNTLSDRDVTSWNALLAGYAEQNQGQLALQLYDQVQREGIAANSHTFVSALKGCGAAAAMEESTLVSGRLVKSNALRRGQVIHADLVECGYGLHTMVCNTLIHMYLKCGSLEDAQLVFDTDFQHDVVSWNVMIAGFAELEQVDQAFQLYEQMEAVSILPDTRTFVSLLKACCCLAAKEVEQHVDGHVLRPASLEKAEQVHREVRERGFTSDVFVNNYLIHTYARCGSIAHARHVFDEHPRRDVVSWNAMIASYSTQEQENNAICLYLQMKSEGVLPSEATFLCILKACGNVGALKMCTDIHQHIADNGVEDSVIVASSLLHAYGKCGRMDKARQLFNKLAKQDVVSWNGLLAGYARQGAFQMSFQCVDEMKQAGVKPDGVTFICLLTACSHAGMLGEGLRCFKSLSTEHGITATMQHYSCIVDLLGRAGFLEQVEKLMTAMPMAPDLPMWLSLLGACRKHGHVKLGELAFASAIAMDPKHTAPYILMSNIYALSGMFADANRIERKRLGGSRRKKPGQSWIEHGKDMEAFVAGDKFSQHSKLVSAKVRDLNLQVGGEVMLQL